MNIVSALKWSQACIILIIDLITLITLIMIVYTRRETYIGLCLVPSELNDCLARLVVVGQRVQEWILQLVKTLQIDISEDCSNLKFVQSFKATEACDLCEIVSILNHESQFVIVLREKMNRGQRREKTTAMLRMLMVTCVIPMMVPTTMRTRRPSTTTKYWGKPNLEHQHQDDDNLPQWASTWSPCMRHSIRDRTQGWRHRRRWGRGSLRSRRSGRSPGCLRWWK